MRSFLNSIRKPINISLPKKVIYPVLFLIAGFISGVFAKMLDETPSNTLPYFLELLDLGNFFSRMGVWIFITVIISLYSKSPMRSGVNVFLFLSGMVGSYYLYTVFIVGFYPKSYMMIWIGMTFISPLLAFICWYAKGKGTIAIFISSIIFMYLSSQSFAFGFLYFDIAYVLELILLIIMTFILYQSPKQIIQVIIIGILLFLITAQINLFWGML